MLCWKCHDPVPDGAKFCENCGAYLDGPEQAKENAEEQARSKAAQSYYAAADTPGLASASAQSRKAKQNKQKKQKKQDKQNKQKKQDKQGKQNKQNKQNKQKKSFPLLLVIILAVVVVAAVVVVLLWMNRKTTVNLDKYVTLSDNGYDGYGTVEVNFDYASFESDCLGKIQFNKKNSEVQSYLSRSAGEIYDEDRAALDLFESYFISYSLKPDSDLSNGDTVTLVWDDLSDAAMSWFNCSLKCQNLTRTVGNLLAVEDVDLFQSVTVSFTGANSAGGVEITVNSSSDLYDNLTFSPSPSAGLSNLDAVTVTVSLKEETASAEGTDSVEEYIARNYGQVPVALSKTYTVSGLEELPAADLFENVNVEFSGTSTAGTAWVNIDSNDPMIQALKYELDVSSGLSNGDIVTVTVSLRDTTEGYDSVAALCAFYGVAPESLSKEYTVSGLEERETVDLFEYINVNFSGISPRGKARIVRVSSDEIIRGLSFDLDRDSGLSIGDTVTVTVTVTVDDSSGVSVEDYLGRNYGVYPRSLTKEYTVTAEDLDGFYMASLSDLPSETLDLMKDKVKSAIDSEVNSWGSSVTRTGTNYLGSCLLCTANLDLDRQNMYYVVYQIDATGSEGDFTYYYCLRFDNIVINRDGTCSVSLESGASPIESFSKNGITISGYETLDALHYSCISEYAANYDHDDDIW